MKLNKLLQLDKVVEETLEEEDLARVDDCFLILRVVQKTKPELAGSSFANVMLNGKTNGISFESITRARRKIQKNRPELTDRDAEIARQAEQIEYIDYAREV